MSLSVLLSHLTALSKLHQFNHWKTQGDLSFQDHLLFERLYNETNDLIDGVAEKSVGLFGNESIDMVADSAAVSKLLSSWKALRVDNALPVASLKATKEVISYITALKGELGKELTEGLDNQLQGICDSLESHCYLLGQRAPDTKQASTKTATLPALTEQDLDLLDQNDFDTWLKVLPTPSDEVMDLWRESIEGGMDHKIEGQAFRLYRQQNAHDFDLLSPSWSILGDVLDHYATNPLQSEAKDQELPEEHVIKELERLKRREQERPRLYIEAPEYEEEERQPTKEQDDKVDFEIRASTQSNPITKLPDLRHLSDEELEQTTKGWSKHDWDAYLDQLMEGTCMFVAEEPEQLTGDKGERWVDYYINPPQIEKSLEKLNSIRIQLTKRALNEDHALIYQSFDECQSDFREFNQARQHERFSVADELGAPLYDRLSDLKRRMLNHVRQDMRKGLSHEGVYLKSIMDDVGKVNEMLDDLRAYQKQRALKRELRDTPDAPLNLAPVVVRKKDKTTLIDPRKFKEESMASKTASLPDYQAIDEEIERILQVYDNFVSFVKSRSLETADKLATILSNTIPATQSDLRSLINEDIDKGFAEDSLVEQSGLKLQLLEKKLKSVKLYQDERLAGLGKGITHKPVGPIIKKKEPVKAEALNRLVALAYHLDLQGLTSEADQIDELIKSLILRVGLISESETKE
jgi:DNA-binding ferritin-like protein